MSLIEKYDRLADGFSEREYAAPSAYAERCAAVIVACAPALVAGASVLDLACGDGLMAGALVARGLRYRGVDASERMVAAARARYPELSFATARIEEFEPPEPVDATICLRAFFYPEDRVAFFRRVASYTRGPFIFDFRAAGVSRPRRHPRRPARRRLLAGRPAPVLPAPAACTAGGGDLAALRDRAQRPARLAADPPGGPPLLRRLGLSRRSGRFRGEEAEADLRAEVAWLGRRRRNSVRDEELDHDRGLGDGDRHHLRGQVGDQGMQDRVGNDDRHVLLLVDADAADDDRDPAGWGAAVVGGAGERHVERPVLVRLEVGVGAEARAPAVGVDLDDVVEQVPGTDVAV